MKMKQIKEIGEIFLPIIILSVIALIFTFGGTYVSSYFEARAYERVTGKQVSTWDAMFLKLRVEGCENE